jgi:hypothetical protein
MPVPPPLSGSQEDPDEAPLQVQAAQRPSTEARKTADREETTTNTASGSAARGSDTSTQPSRRQASARLSAKAPAEPPASVSKAPRSKVSSRKSASRKKAAKKPDDAEQVAPAPRTLAEALERCESKLATALVNEAARFAEDAGKKRLITTTAFFKAFVALAKADQRTTPIWVQTWLRDNGAANWIERVREERARTAAGSATALSAQAAHLIARAEGYARLTLGRPGISARHLIAAIVVPGDAQIEGTIVGNLLSACSVDVRGFTPTLLSQLTHTGYESDESADEWEKLLGVAPPPSRPDFANDRPDGGASDALDIGPDVTAFAQLICLETATPPLSIGLFGDWGSGKTFFMERIKERIARIAESARNAEQIGAPSPFVPNVVQIRFNAWHYADANLWACLTAEFFDQLRLGGVDAKPGAAYDKLVTKVAEKVRSLESDVVAAKVSVDQRAAAVKAKTEEVSEARAALADAMSGAFSDHAGTALKTVFDQNQSKLREIGKQLYGGDLSKDIATFAGAAREASSLPGKLGVIFRAMTSGRRGFFCAVAIILILAVIATGGLVSTGAFASLRLGGLAAALASAIGVAWSSYSYVKPIIDGAYAFAIDATTRQAALAKALAVKETELKTAQQAASDAEADLKKARDNLKVYGPDEERRAQSTLLQYFLFEDAETREYDKHVGLVSRARHSFETLNSIVTRSRNARAAAERVAQRQANPVPPKDAAEEAAFEGDRKLAAEYAGAIRVPDRIVLYIDDLDRCTHEQVYQVLQAVHLLLAFELFVVVVGVDVRWVQSSMARLFASDSEGGSGAKAMEHLAAAFAAKGDFEMAAGAIKQSIDETQLEHRQRAISYLEKIFQVPFWLRKLTSEQGNNVYGRYVDALLAVNRKADEAPQPPPGPVGAGRGKGNEPLMVEPMRPLGEGSDLAPVLLTEDEIGLLGSPELGQLAGTSPRAVKRLINIYRLYRARLQGANLDRFVGHAGIEPDYPIIATILAIETGATPAAIAAFDKAIQIACDAQPAESLYEFAAGSSVAGFPDEAVVQMGAALKATPEIATALAKAAGLRKNMSLEDWRNRANELKRYSFHRPEAA